MRGINPAGLFCYVALFLAGCGPQAPAEAPAATPSAQAGDVATTARPDAVPAQAAAPANEANATIEIRGVTLPPYREVVLDNGARLFLMEKRDVPLVAFHASLRGGVVAEAASRNGSAALTADLLAQGAGERGARSFAEAVSSVGGRFDTRAELEALVVTGEFMREDADLMVELLADVLRRPNLDEGEFDKLRARAVQSLSAAKDSDLRSLIKPYAQAFVHGDHPYGRAISGSEASLATLSHEDILAYHRNHVGADRLQLTVVGDFDADKLAARLGEAFGDWQAAAEPWVAVPPPKAAKGGRVLLVDKPGAAQTYFWVGNLGVAHADPQTPAVDLVNTLFGGRFTSMLNNALRVESGLTYGARSLLERPTQPGSVGMFSFCATENTTAALDLALAQLALLHGDGFDEQTLASGRNYILGTYTLGLETGPQMAEALAQLKFFDEADAVFNDYASRVAAIDGGAAEAVVERVYPTREESVFVFIGDADAIRGEVEQYGTITELPISAPVFSP